jgi:hypothetical protein
LKNATDDVENHEEQRTSITENEIVIEAKFENKSSSKNIDENNINSAAEIHAATQSLKTKRYEVGNAPISKADIGKKVDRFAKLVQERQKNQTSNIG